MSHFVSMLNGLNVAAHFEGAERRICMQGHVVLVRGQAPVIGLVGLGPTPGLEKRIALHTAPFSNLTLLHFPAWQQ